MVMVLFVLLGAFAETPAQRPTEYEVKAAFLYNFARFVAWPDSAFADKESPLVIGVMEPDPFGAVLDRTIFDKRAQGRRIEVRRFKRLEDVQGCHMLFVSPSSYLQWPALLAHLGTAPVLTVGEGDGFCESGGIINFVLQQNHVRFEINPDAANRADLAISSRLLKLAQLVKDAPREEQ